MHRDILVKFFFFKKEKHSKSCRVVQHGKPTEELPFLDVSVATLATYNCPRCAVMVVFCKTYCLFLNEWIGFRRFHSMYTIIRSNKYSNFGSCIAFSSECVEKLNGWKGWGGGRERERVR